MYNILLVGGDFNNEGGRKSGVVKELEFNFNKNPELNLTTYNGGEYNELEKIIDTVYEYDFIIWMANVPNELNKIRNIKTRNQRVILCTSKANTYQKYTTQDIVARALNVKANLIIEIYKKFGDDKYAFKLLDPLGNMWYNNTNIPKLCEVLYKRFVYLKSIKRAQSIQASPDAVDIPKINKVFLGRIRECSEIFHDLIKPSENCERFLGNASFRCLRGFPSCKIKNNVYVSRRNVDKSNITAEDFVSVFSNKSSISRYYYKGKNKPSVDTPVQLALYDELPKIRYMIHSHCYIEGAPYTTTMIPCGGLEEIDEILNTIDRYYGSHKKRFYAINLIGHGSIVMSKRARSLRKVKYRKRFLPEISRFPSMGID